MTWTRTLMLCAVMMAGCSIKIEPIPPKKPVIQHVHHRKHSFETETPTPTPSPRKDRPLELQPTEKPTPIINLGKSTAWNLSAPLL